MSQAAHEPSFSTNVQLQLCPIATGVFADVFAAVQPPEYLNALLEASRLTANITGGGVPAKFAAGESDMQSEKSFQSGLFQCRSIAGFLSSYGLVAGLPPRSEGELPRQRIFVGVACFNEHPDEIIPTIESILRSGGDDALKVHIILACDIALGQQKDRVDSVPFGVTWTRPDGRISLTYLNKGLKQFTGKSSSLYLIAKYTCAIMAQQEIATNASNSGINDIESQLYVQPKNYLLLADTRIIYGVNSVRMLTSYLQNHDDVIACTGTHELYPIRGSVQSIAGTPTRKLEERRPNLWYKTSDICAIWQCFLLTRTIFCLNQGVAGRACYATI